MTTASQAAPYLNTTGHITTSGLRIAVRCLDIKTSYGRVRYLVTPVAGTGEVWTEGLTMDNSSTTAINGAR